jgi:NitT/TauT family transport system ATP-binding protein
MAADSGIEESHSMRSAVASPPPGVAPACARGDGAAIVRIAALKKTFGDLEAIRQLSFDVGDGEFLSVLGPSGCGKSTLLMMIAGLIDPTAGEIRIQDAKVAGPRREVGVVFQSPVLLLRMAKIDEFAGLLPRQLSGGMRQRVAICRALVHDPSILLMDEPFSALDAITRDEMAVELQRIWQANRKTVIFVTHSIREAAFLSDRVLVMGRRPATIIDELTIDLPRPRHIAVTEDETFNRLVRHLRKAIEASHAE